MQHLFGNTYVTLFGSFEPGVKCALVSPIVDQLPTDEFMARVVTDELGEVVWQGTTLDDFPINDVVASFAQDVEQRTVIYVDHTMYPAFLYAWYKATFPSADPMLMTRLSITNTRYTFGHQFSPRKRITPDVARQFRQIHQTLSDQHPPVGASFVLADDVRQIVMQNQGIEVALASYLVYRSSWAAERIEQMAMRTLLDFTMGWIRQVIQTPHSIPGFDYTSYTIEEWVQEHPEYALLADMRARSGGSLSYVLQTYGIDVVQRVSRDVAQWCGAADTYTFKHLNVDDVIAAEVSYPFNSVYLASGRRDALVNQILLHRLLKEANAPDKPLARSIAIE